MENGKNNIFWGRSDGVEYEHFNTFPQPTAIELNMDFGYT
jgi:hypothetical protein